MPSDRRTERTLPNAPRSPSTPKRMRAKAPALAGMEPEMTDINKDELTGKQTTGHSWDGIQELNNPLPKWWLNVLYASIAFSVLWWVLYPAIPWFSGYTKGVLGYNSHGVYHEEAAAAAGAQRVWIDKIGAST